MTVTLCLSCSLGLLNRRPRSSLCWVICYILSATSQVPKLHWGSRGPPRPGVAFPTTPRLQLSGTLLATPLARRTQLNYIIVQRPLDLWNRMFNRHQAEITVMQFRGHSLSVHQSMSVPWEFFSSSHFISQFPPTRFPHITAIRMCHFLPVHHLEWHFWPGQKVKTQHIELLRCHFLFEMILIFCRVLSVLYGNHFFGKFFVIKKN